MYFPLCPYPNYSRTTLPGSPEQDLAGSIAFRRWVNGLATSCSWQKNYQFHGVRKGSISYQKFGYDWFLPAKIGIHISEFMIRKLYIYILYIYNVVNPCKPNNGGSGVRGDGMWRLQPAPKLCAGMAWQGHAAGSCCPPWMNVDPLWLNPYKNLSCEICGFNPLADLKPPSWLLNSEGSISKGIHRFFDFFGDDPDNWSIRVCCQRCWSVNNQSPIKVYN